MVSLWTYSCKVYDQPNVQAACLLLQEEQDIDIPLLLFCCWCGCFYGEASQTLLNQVIAQSQRWSNTCVRPLRQVRQSMKSQREQQEKWRYFHQENWESLREEVKALELLAEKHLLQEMELLVRQEYSIPQEITDIHQLKGVLSNFGRCGIDIADCESSIKAIVSILQGVFPQFQQCDLVNSIHRVNL